MGVDIRVVDGNVADSDAWYRGLHHGFTLPPAFTEEELALRRARIDLRRAWGAFDQDRCVATYRSFDQRLTVPGGRDVAANAITAVTVSATHRRRGLLTRMITSDLAEAKERGDTVATLVAAEYPIYGRYGFGPATSTTAWEVDRLRAGLDRRAPVPDPAEGGSIEFLDGAEVRKLGPELYERFRPGCPGAIDRPALWWDRATGEVRMTPSWTEPFHALHRDADGIPQGMVTFRADTRWTNGMPDETATVASLFAVTPAAERALWHFLLSVDWVTRVKADHRAPDDLLPDLLPDPRAAAVTDQADFLWLRPLDIPAMLTARGYPAEGELVLRVDDPLGLTAGSYLLTASPQGADCVPTSRPADLTLGTGALATLYLGERSAGRLARLGRLTEERPGAAARADLLFHTPRRPWLPDIF
ncbi:GNAT family N-acetyltransferase [Streptomyces aidingensis]|uniref:Predicted acetyltransferase n=1 Tax=Streptomyces aidingensis TaxID=910347 RepID=A0A1I1HRD1_9ACTN|nr:GNAT family N-acetyltransferase [Streptomyces aidingensis]SFC26426.1 Predicted acetyltransferase [Streptomyces aidingensis]